MRGSFSWSGAARFAGFCLVVLLGLAVAGNRHADAQTRHALVIGIDRYENVPDLLKAGNDARAIAEVLEVAGFQVTLGVDIQRRDYSRLMSDFTRSITPGDEAIFYFAGHGIEVDGRNYLLPADVPAARPGDEDFVRSESIAVDHVLEMIGRAGARVSVVILDACRDNPFPREGTRSLGGGRGLGRVAPAEGTFVLYSAGINQLALDRLSDDDPDPNSVFTRALLPLLVEPGLPVQGMVRRVRQQVRELAQTVGHTQFPAYYDQLTDDYHIIQASLPGIDHEVPGIEGPVVSDPCTAARADWVVLRDSDSVPALQRYVETHARCPTFASLAQERISELEPAKADPNDWRNAISREFTENHGGIRSIAFSPDSRRVVTSGDLHHTVSVWDAETGSEITTFSGHKTWVFGVAFSPDGKRILSRSNDKTARIWDVESGRDVATLAGHTDVVRSAAFSPNGKRVVTTSNDATARVWDADTGRDVATLSGHSGYVWNAAFSPEGLRIVTASRDNTARIWDADSGRHIATLSGHSSYVWRAVFSPDGESIVTASSDGTAKVWEDKSGREIATLSGHTADVTQAWFSPDGQRIVTASSDNTARVWDARSGLEIMALQGHTDQVESAEFSPNGRWIVTASRDGTARIWEANDGREVTVLDGKAMFVTGAAFSPDSQQIVTHSVPEGIALIWSVQ